MKKLLALVVLVISLACVHAEDAKPAPQVQKWEYAFLSYDADFIGTWTSANVDVKEETVSDPTFHHRLAVAGAIAERNEKVDQFSDLWGAIGERGWELVSARSTARTNFTEYIFKRVKQ